MQTSFPFLSVMPAPKNAPDALVARITSASEAIAVSMRANGFKQSWYAAQLGKSEAYISLIASGKRPVPRWFVQPFCVLAGSNLLRQYLDLQDALHAIREQNCARRQIEQYAQMLRAA
jgi:hypothetical protein